MLVTQREIFDRYRRMPVHIVHIWCPETKQGYPISIPSWLYANAEQVATEVHQLACRYRNWEYSKLVGFLLKHPDFSENK